MNQEKIGKLIKKIRIKNKLSQKEFADKYGVTPQAVSKWETGKNIPDIAILKEICNDNNLKIDEFLSAKSMKRKNVMIIIIILLCFIVIGIGVITVKHNNDTFKLKTITSACKEFGLYGSIAYNKSKSSIYIDNVTYCGEKKLPKYKKISCTLFEREDREKILSLCQQSLLGKDNSNSKRLGYISLQFLSLIFLLLEIVFLFTKL